MIIHINTVKSKDGEECIICQEGKIYTNFQTERKEPVEMNQLKVKRPQNC